MTFEHADAPRPSDPLSSPFDDRPSSSSRTSSEDGSFLERTWKRFQNRKAPHVPLLHLDREGSIVHATPAARRLLEYPFDKELNPCFFTYVHGRNLRRVMRDLAHMVCHRMQQTSWLLRLRTGTGRWRWYRAIVRNGLHDSADGTVLVRLRTL